MRARRTHTPEDETLNNNPEIKRRAVDLGNEGSL